MTAKEFRYKLKRVFGAPAYRTMYDGINSDAPAIARAFPTTPMVAGYIDGNFTWSQSDWNLFPHAVHVYITYTASVDSGDVIDCESGDATPDQAAAWVRMRKSKGYYRPTIYCNLDTAPAVRQATGNMILGEDYDMWIAWYNGDPTQFVFSDGRKAVAKQYLSPAGGFYDKSSVYSSTWPTRTDPKPTAKGPYEHIVPAGNTHSLDWIAKQRNMKNYDEIVAVSKTKLNAVNMAVMNAYISLDNTCKNAKIDDATMPTGMRYWTENP